MTHGSSPLMIQPAPLVCTTPGRRRPGATASRRSRIASTPGPRKREPSPSELEQSIRAVAREETCVSPTISTHVVAAYLQHVGGGGISSRYAIRMGLITPDP